MMLIPSGQAASLSSTDEAVVSGELNTAAGVSGETSGEHPFDETLEELLTQHSLDERMLEELLEDEGLAVPLVSELLTQNPLEPEIPAEKKDSLSRLSELLSKANPITQEEFEVVDPRFSLKEGTVNQRPGMGVSESGLQAGLQKNASGEFQESVSDEPGLAVQNVLHQTQPLDEDSVASEKYLQSVLRQEIHAEAQELEAVQKTQAERFRAAGMIRPGEVVEESAVSALNRLAALASGETRLSGEAKSSVDSVLPASLATLPETSGLSIFKGGDSASASSFAETLQKADLPFDMEQVVNRVRILRGNGTEEMTLRLHPEELGQITLRVRQSGGELSIDMRVDNPLAKQMVESGFETLRSRFLDQEFAYQDLALNVDLNQRNSQFGKERSFAEFQEEMFSTERGKGEEEISLDSPPRLRSRSDSGLNLYV